MKYCGVEIPMPPELRKEYDRIKRVVLKVVSEYHENPKNPPIPPMD